ncbi:hypothetical protein ACPSLY_16160 [Vibrio parahaemolyticus]|uniref:hypothetical protein n=1 Tax=Vibrio harveyi group TaxID=717610 RepID=UPI000A361F9E|nr:hypothetical protein [Vibrio parahaemolyticus]EHK0753576.1 hypothetical protein [Vibrio parahaemolyticus]MBE3912370.1 hypothetical protein [Vibrio parahaemolyticus]MBE4268377.1 hypothetical protein [Vibrio parahaemolyticus]MBE4282309.1 hypothetical protein [Vibrio parahaemolyticus]MBY7715720.1 hypothetical protein [Vibrio parahaemolyticus]
MLKKIVMIGALLLSAQVGAQTNEVNSSTAANFLRNDRALFSAFIDKCGMAKYKQSIDFQLLDDTSSFALLHINTMLRDRTVDVNKATVDYLNGDMNLKNLASSIGAFKFFGQYQELYRMAVTNRQFVIYDLGKDEWSKAFKDARIMFDNGEKQCDEVSLVYKGYTDMARQFGVIN